jgi:hypothetical protein
MVSPKIIANALVGKRNYVTDDGSSVSIADASRQEKGSRKGLGALDSKVPSRPQEISLFSVTLGRNSILTWSHLMIKTPIAIAATAALGLSFAQPALRQSNGSPTSTR